MAEALLLSPSSVCAFPLQILSALVPHLWRMSPACGPCGPTSVNHFDVAPGTWLSSPPSRGTLGTLSVRRAVWVTIPEYRRNSATYVHTFVTYRLPPTHHFFLLFDCCIPLFGPLSFTNGTFDSVPNRVWAHKMVAVEEPPLILSPGLTLGTPKTAGVMQPFRPLLGPREGRGEVANFDSVPLLGTPQKTGVT